MYTQQGYARPYPVLEYSTRKGQYLGTPMSTWQRALEENDLNPADHRSEIGRPETAKSVDHRYTGGNSVPEAFACVKSGKGRVAPVYSREISKIFLVKFKISDLWSVGLEVFSSGALCQYLKPLN